MKKISKKIYDFVSAHTELFIFIVAAIISLSSFIYFFSQGLTLAFGDSLGHLNIARRVFDSPTPGIAQLGGYWLPIFQIMMLPTIWIDFFWKTGLSGSIINMISFIITVLFTYKLSFLITNNKHTSLLAAIVIMFNPNFIFMQSTPMTEPLFIATLILSIYYFYKWILFKKMQELFFAGVFIVLTSLNRYEGWALVAASSALLVFEWVKDKLNKKWEGTLILFTFLAWYGIFLWILWGLVIFNDPFEFLHNELSSGNQTKAAFGAALPTGDHNLLLAISTNILSAYHTGGLAIISLALVGVLSYLLRNYKKIFSLKTLSLFLLFTPFLFDIITVFTGSVPVEVAELSKLQPPTNIFNIRYSLFLLPALAIFISLISKKKLFIYAFVVLVFLNYVLLNFDDGSKLYILRDAGATNSKDMNVQNLHNDVTWFKEHYTGGMVLISTGGSDGFMHQVGFHLDNYIVEGSYKIWDNAMDDPAKYATWVVTSKYNALDLVYKHINKKRLYSDFTIVYQDNGFMVLKNNNSKNETLSIK